jgi:hypothetical protein
LGCLQLEFVAGPVDGTVGIGQTVQVRAVANGVTQTSFTGNVTIEKVSGPGGLSGNVATADAGVATFSNFQGDAGGLYVVKATSPGLADSSTEPSFTLFEESIPCGGTVTEGPVTVMWLQESLGEDFPGCETGDTKPVTLTFTDTPEANELELLSTGTVVATFQVDVNAWLPEPAVTPVPATQVSPPDPFHDVLWCEGTPAAPEMPSGESWCLVSQSTVSYGPDGDGTEGNPDWVPDYEGQLMQVTETFLLTADAGARRK